MRKREFRVAGSCMAALAVAYAPAMMAAPALATLNQASQQQQAQPSAIAPIQIPIARCTKSKSGRMRICWRRELPRIAISFRKKRKRPPIKLPSSSRSFPASHPIITNPRLKKSKRIFPIRRSRSRKRKIALARPGGRSKKIPKTFEPGISQNSTAALPELNRLLEHLRALQMRLQESSPQAISPAPSPAPSSPVPPSL